MNELLKSADYQDLVPLFLQLELVPREDFLRTTLVKRIAEIGGNSLTNVFRDGEAAGYLSMLLMIAEAVGAPYSSRAFAELRQLDDKAKQKRSSIGSSSADRISAGVYELEERILEQVLAKLQQNLTSSQKEEAKRFFHDLMANHGIRDSKALLGAGGLMVAGELGGFGTYMALTSLLHTLSLGTFGFGVYTTASSLLSFMLGPVGWSALGLWALFRIGKPKVKEIFPVVIIIALIRRKYEGVQSAAV